MDRETGLPELHGTYHEDPAAPAYWFYGDYRIQAAIEAHRYAVGWAVQHLSPGTRILDVAAGQGALARQLIDEGFDVSCTSWDGRCRVTAPVFAVDLDRPFSIADVGGRPFPLVCCVEIIEHLENPAKFLRDCHSLVAPDGHLILTTPNVESSAARLQWLLRGEPSIFSSEEVRKNRHISMLWRAQLEFLIDLAGFRIVQRPVIRAVVRRPNEWSGRVRRLLKRLAYWAIETGGRGEPVGDTRIYVLEPTGDEARRTGPGDVY